MMQLVDAIRRAGGYRFPPLGSSSFRLLFRLLPARANVELVPGIRVDLDFGDDTMRATYWKGDRFEKPTAQVLDGWAKSATHFFDIGSNYGFFSYWLLSRRPGLQVHAFEPNPETFARLEKIRTLNGLSSLQAWNIGLSDTFGRLTLHPGRGDSGHSTFGPHPELKLENLGEVEVAPFDRWRSEHGLPLPDRPAWIAKIDVEGFETRVLRGMSESLNASAFAGLVVEINEYTLRFCDSTGAEVRQILHDSGYREEQRAPESGNAYFVPAK
jgi:FkbM family methyltransferase